MCIVTRRREALLVALPIVRKFAYDHRLDPESAVQIRMTDMGTVSHCNCCRADQSQKLHDPTRGSVLGPDGLSLFDDLRRREAAHAAIIRRRGSSAVGPVVMPIRPFGLASRNGERASSPAAFGLALAASS
jgi:hypothetical protein